MAGCGFQLAGTTPDAVNVEQVYVQSKLSIQLLVDQPVAEQLRSDLASSKATEVHDRAQADMPGLIITNEENIERSISLSSGLFDRQVEVGKRVQYQILSATGELLVTDSIHISKELSVDQSNPSARVQEQAILIDSINRDISRQLIRQLIAALAAAT